MMAFLIGVLILISFLLILYFMIQSKLRRLSKKLFGTSDLTKFIEKGEFLDEETPKSLSSLDSLYLDQIKEDFPLMNIQELKAKVEENILDFLHAIEKKNSNKMKHASGKIKSYTDSRIKDLGNHSIQYKNIRFHKTVVAKYEKSKGIATIVFGTAFEYLYRKDNEMNRKKQDRMITECIYVIDSSKVESHLKSFGLNCPNCGAPIQSLKHKSCSYCGSGVVDLVTRSFVIHDIKNK